MTVFQIEIVSKKRLSIILIVQDLLKINNGRAFVYERLEVTLFKDLQTLKLKVFQRFSILFQRVALAETSNSEHIEVPIAVHIVVTIQP